MLKGDQSQGIFPGTSLDAVDGRVWKCPSCKGPHCNFARKSHLEQEMVSHAGASRLVIVILSSLSNQSELIIAQESHIMRLLRECMSLGSSLLSGHNHFVMGHFYRALKQVSKPAGTRRGARSHPFCEIVGVMLRELAAWVRNRSDSAANHISGSVIPPHTLLLCPCVLWHALVS